MSNFRVGQKVVCLKSDWTSLLNKPFNGKEMPTKGSVYTVSSIHQWENKPFIGLKEIAHRNIFRSAAFRPVAERKTDISIFLAMLNPSKAKQLKPVSSQE